MLVEQTHEVRHEWRNNERPMRYTDTRLDEQQRGVSLKMVPMSLLLEASSGKSYLMNMIDTPGEHAQVVRSTPSGTNSSSPKRRDDHDAGSIIWRELLRQTYATSIFNT